MPKTPHAGVNTIDYICFCCTKLVPHMVMCAVMLCMVLFMAVCMAVVLLACMPVIVAPLQ